jgi:hypothetical protein
VGKHLKEPSRAGFGRIFTVNRCHDKRQALHQAVERKRGVSLTDAGPDCKLTECCGVAKLADIPTVPENAARPEGKELFVRVTNCSKKNEEN